MKINAENPEVIVNGLAVKCPWQAHVFEPFVSRRCCCLGLLWNL